eukprot:scaffold221375_cov55-Attheya_sp.AAC.1
MVFALTPAQANPGVIDMATTEGRKMYVKAISPLLEELFDCMPDGLFGFLKELSDRADDHDWNEPYLGILQIPEDPADANTNYDDLLTLYGQISIERIRKFEETYIDQEVCSAQDSHMLYKCLMNLISKEGKSKILVWEDDYKIGEYKS